MEQERTNLDLHVDLCAKRYQELDNRLSKLETKLDTINVKVDSLKGDLVKALMPVLGTMAVAVITLIGTIIVKIN
jgi:tetrahydromethanopterin S-methyltransferase subunit G